MVLPVQIHHCTWNPNSVTLATSLAETASKVDSGYVLGNNFKRLSYCMQILQYINYLHGLIKNASPVCRYDWERYVPYNSENW